MHRTLWLRSLLVLLGLAVNCTIAWSDDEGGSKSVALEQDSGSLGHARALSRAFRQSAERAMPSVVTVFSRSTRSGDEPSVLDVIGGEDSQLYDNVGSGVVVTDDGLILTNHHVIADARRIEVRLLDGRQFTAIETKSDPTSDVAILRIEVDEKLPAAELGDSDGLYVGDWVLAIGSPFTLESSVSAGIISGTGRMRRLSNLVAGQFLQTDAAINPGNSGGPLIDLDGRVIGINTAISSRTGGFEGIGFAIPINRAKWIKNELLKYDRVRRGYVGVRTSNVPYEISKELKLPRNAGAWVNVVVPDYPAAKAGLQSGDVIVELAEQRIDSAGAFAEVVQQSQIGKPLSMIIYRKGEKMELTIELQERR